MSMTKREIAIASVDNSLRSWVDSDARADVARHAVDQLIRDGVIALSYAGDPDISEVVDHFQIAFKTTATIRTDRFAAGRLVKRHGREVVLSIIQDAAKRKNEKFAPVVNSLTQLEQKWPAVEKFVTNKVGGLDV